MHAAISLRPSSSAAMPLQIAGGDHQQREHGNDRHGSQDSRGHAAVSAGGAHLSLQAKPFANDVGQAGQNFAQVTARLALHHHRGGEKAHVEQGYPFGQVAQRQFDGRAQVLLVEERAEFHAHRIGHFVAHHLQADGEGVAGAHGAGQEIERLGELLFKERQPGGSLVHDEQVRQQQGRRPAQQGRGKSRQCFQQRGTRRGAHAAALIAIRMSRRSSSSRGPPA